MQPLKNWSPFQLIHKLHIVRLCRQPQPRRLQHTQMLMFNQQESLQLKYATSKDSPKSFVSNKWIYSFFLFCFQYTLAQPANYYSQAAYTPRVAYAPSLSATSSTPFVSSYQQSASQAIQSAQATNTNGAIQYASQVYQQPSFTAAKYGYSQIPTAPKYFYASS